MSDLVIEGGVRLNGEVTIQGSKNAALPMMAASVLHKGISILRGCPKISDVYCMEEILQNLGAVTWWQGKDLYLDCEKADGKEIPTCYTEKMRSSVILMAPILARNGSVTMGYPGGCVIGKRPIDMHVKLLKELGIEIREEKQKIHAYGKQLRGNHIFFRRKSVGATEQAILAAVTAQGETILTNCAQEPEIRWLCTYLRKMGAEIEDEEGDKIYIQGKTTLGHGEIEVPADRIVAGTYMCAAAATRGKILIKNAPVEELHAFLEIYRKMGGQYECRSGKLEADGRGISLPIPFLKTEVYPGFPTDLQSPLMTVLATIQGRSCICETIFEERFKSAWELKKMGAQIQIQDHCIWIEGGKPLCGCHIRAEELRGGAALLLAGLAAEGRTCLDGYSFIARGYEDICRDIRALGGRIEKDMGRDLYENRKLYF